MRRSPSLLAVLASLVVQATSVVAEELPRVLFLCDGVHKSVVDEAAKELKAKITVVYPSTDVSDTNLALEQLDTMLGDGGWDLIYFNFGLGDLFYRDPKSKEIRAMSKYSGGVRVTSPARYEQNLEALVLRLKETGAKLLWSTTTPIAENNGFPSYSGNLYDQGSAAEYNEIAAGVMTRHGVPVIDVHSFIMRQYGAEVRHPTHRGYQRDMQRKKMDPAHRLVVEAVLKHLGEAR